MSILDDVDPEREDKTCNDVSIMGDIDRKGGQVI